MTATAPPAVRPLARLARTIAAAIHHHTRGALTEDQQAALITDLVFAVDAHNTTEETAQ